MARSIGEIHQHIYPNTTVAATIRFNVVQNWSNTQMMSIISNKEVVKRIGEELVARSKIIDESFNVLKREFDSDEGRKLVAAALTANEDFNVKRKVYIAKLADDDKDPANFFLVGPLKSSLEDYLGNPVGFGASRCRGQRHIVSTEGAKCSQQRFCPEHRAYRSDGQCQQCRLRKRRCRRHRDGKPG